MIPANGGNLKIGKGAAVAADWADFNTPPADGFDGIPLGNSESVSLEPGDVQTQEKFSSTEAAAPLLDRRNTRQTPAIVVQCDEHTRANLRRYFLGTLSEVTQAAAVGQTAEFVAVVGGVFDLGKFGTTITSVIADGSKALVVNEDFRHYPERGRIELIDGGLAEDGDELVVSFSASEQRVEKIVGSSRLNSYVRFTFFSDDTNVDGVSAKGIFTVYKAQLSPEGAYALVQDGYGTVGIRFTMLRDSRYTELYKVEYPEAA